MTFDLALTLLNLTRSELDKPDVVKKKFRSALKKNHPDISGGSQQKFINCQDAIKMVESHIKNKKNPVAYVNKPVRKKYEQTDTKPPWFKKATHGDKFSDIHVQ